MHIVAQNATITIGRGTNCFGRGPCSISIELTNNYNATFMQNPNGTTTLRVFRNKISQNKEHQLFGVTITDLNSSILKFRVDESMKCSHFSSSGAPLYTLDDCLNIQVH